LQRSLSESQTQDELIIDNLGGQVQLRLLQSASQYALTFVSIVRGKENLSGCHHQRGTLSELINNNRPAEITETT